MVLKILMETYRSAKLAKEFCGRKSTKNFRKANCQKRPSGRFFAFMCYMAAALCTHQSIGLYPYVQICTFLPIHCLLRGTLWAPENYWRLEKHSSN